MIRLTVLYNLPEGADEAEFLRWRLGEHQHSNASMFGVLRTDFGRVDSRWTPEDRNATTPYRFMTIVDYPDQETFEKSFYDPAGLDKLVNQDLKKLANPLFLVSEILVST